MCIFLEKLHRDVISFPQENYNHRKKKESLIKPHVAEVQKLMLEEEAKLLKLKEGISIELENLPKKFGHALAFPQLTVDPSAR